MGTLIPKAHALHRVNAEEDVGAVRRAVGRLALDGKRAAEAMLIATELASNVLRHAGGGHMLVRELDPGAELIAVDGGDGIDQMTLARLAQEPVSTEAQASFGRGGLGVGLGTVKRLSSEFDVYAPPRGGSVVLSRVQEQRLSGEPDFHAADGARWGAIDVPLDGIGPSGDAWMVVPGSPLLAMVVDGLGHGPAAAAASAAAVSAVAAAPYSEAERLLELTHRAMRGTRGGVIGLCLADAQAQELSFVGIGNISARVLADGCSRSLVSYGGTVGVSGQLPTHRLVQHRWPPGAVAILASDGLRSSWDATAYPGLLEHDPTLIAAVLHRDFARPNDDVAVLVLKDRRGSDIQETSR